LKRLIIIEKFDDVEFIAKDEVNDEYLVFKDDEIKVLNLLKKQKTIFKGGENMDENVIREIDAIENFLKVMR